MTKEIQTLSRKLPISLTSHANMSATDHAFRLTMSRSA